MYVYYMSLYSDFSLSSVGLVKFFRCCFFCLLFFHKFMLPIGEIMMNIIDGVRGVARR